MSDDKRPGNVIPLRPRPQPEEDETCFMLCPCEPEGVPFIVVGLACSNPKIIGLMCPECEQELSVIDGVVCADDVDG